MKPATKILRSITIAVVCIVLIVTSAPLFLNSKIERFSEDDLPRVSIENGADVYCRMQADDFRFSLPVGGVASKPEIRSSGFDSIEGYVIVSFPDKAVSATTYQKSIQGSLQNGGVITVKEEPGSSQLKVSFSYFGDR